jgi:nucleotide-binding universal stress UspA family protein
VRANEERSVNAVPNTSEPRQIATILVGVDGSPESDRAAAFAARLATQLGAEIVAAHAVGLLDVWPEHPETHDKPDPLLHVTTLMKGPWTDTIRQLGVQPRIILVNGPPARVLLDLADEIDADLIVVGSRGVGQAELFTLGDTSARLAHQSARPVLIVPPRRPGDDAPPVEGRK